ncbi:MAG: pilus assembly protein PilP [Nitrospirota bacterium]
MLQGAPPAKKAEAPAPSPVANKPASQEGEKAVKAETKDAGKAVLGEKKPQAPPVPVKDETKKEAAKDVQKDKKDKIEEKAEQKETEYVYDPTGKRDPFRSAILGESLRGKEILPPLQRREISELKLIGIVWDKGGYSAMLETPDAKGYTIKVGTLIGPKKGVVKKITKRTVVIEEKYMDIIGEMKTREVVMELPSKEEVLE